ncbi:hypothetical protein D0Y65_015588 [Glycine soja]|uniref:DUF4218 domain-containing protein n=1 Tax=Glycine soja TaxID=3848 RepID=A0A445KE07_GLYSO|nr:hypothetical protein D0Y65_015588 [Glycine soja]
MQILLLIRGTCDSVYAQMDLTYVFKHHLHLILVGQSLLPRTIFLQKCGTHGRLACAYCMEDTKAFQLANGGKTYWFDCHRRFLPSDHAFRRNKNAFKNGELERDEPPSYDARLGGPVQYRWMYPFERFMGDSKRAVKNKVRVEGSIYAFYIHRRPSGKELIHWLTGDEKDSTHVHVLINHVEVKPYLNAHNVRQVYYVPYPATRRDKHGWCVAIKMKPKGYIESDHVQDDVPYQVDEMSHVNEVIEVENISGLQDLRVRPPDVAATPSPPPTEARPFSSHVDAPGPSTVPAFTPSPSSVDARGPSPVPTSTPSPSTVVANMPIDEDATNLVMEDPSINDCLMVTLINLAFHPSKVATKAITLSIRQQFGQPWPTQGAIPKDHRELFF